MQQNEPFDWHLSPDIFRMMKNWTNHRNILSYIYKIISSSNYLRKFRSHIRQVVISLKIKFKIKFYQWFMANQTYTFFRYLSLYFVCSSIVQKKKKISLIDRTYWASLKIDENSNVIDSSRKIMCNEHNLTDILAPKSLSS